MATPAKDYSNFGCEWQTLRQAMAYTDMCYTKFMVKFYPWCDKFEGGDGTRYWKEQLDARIRMLCVLKAEKKIPPGFYSEKARNIRIE